MPIYEFRCQQCDQEFAIARPITHHPKTATCPRCDAATEKRVYRVSLPRCAKHTARAQIQAVAPVPTHTFTNNTFMNCGTGISMGGGYVKSSGNRFINTQTAVDNWGGVFDDQGSSFE